VTGNELKVLVVDDEQPARQRLLDLLNKERGVSLREVCDGQRAIEMILADRPDLVFLDIQMPGVTGLEVVDSVGSEAMPLTIFVTAYDQFAIQAFESNAIDYLLKPFSDERFEASLARARSRMQGGGAREWGARLVAGITEASARRPLDRLVVKSGGATRLLRDADIDWIEAAGVYVTVHAGQREYLYRASLAHLEERLSPRLFVRIHRSAIVNIERIDFLSPISHGEFEVALKCGGRLKLSRTYRTELEQRLGQPL
jgi:two-component system LytT family response regulator